VTHENQVVQGLRFGEPPGSVLQGDSQLKFPGRCVQTLHARKDQCWFIATINIGLSLFFRFSWALTTNPVAV